MLSINNKNNLTSKGILDKDIIAIQPLSKIEYNIKASKIDI